MRAATGLLPRVDAVGLDLATAAVVFGTIFLVELPDKTFIATLVMSTRWRPLLVWIGVSLAFLVQTAVAVLAGGLISRLPRTLVEVVACLMFLLGGILLLRGAGQADAEEADTEAEFGAKAAGQVVGWRVVTLSFTVLFLAEWGDLSQILTLNLVAKYGSPVSVFFGSWVALLTVSGLAVIGGRVLLRYMRLSLLHYIAAGVCLIFVVVGVFQLAAA
jgi:Ca2+/H+ antiporter, TMEM165/GDT1 family